MDVQVWLQDIGLHPKDVRHRLIGGNKVFICSPSELIYADESGIYRAPLLDIVRFSADKSGNMDIHGPNGVLYSASLRGFPQDGIKPFFASVRQSMELARQEPEVDEVEAAKATAPKATVSASFNAVTLDLQLATDKRGLLGTVQLNESHNSGVRIAVFCRSQSGVLAPLVYPSSNNVFTLTPGETAFLVFAPPANSLEEPWMFSVEEVKPLKTHAWLPTPQE